LPGNRSVPRQNARSLSELPRRQNGSDLEDLAVGHFREPLAFAADAGSLWGFNRLSPAKPCQKQVFGKRRIDACLARRRGNNRIVRGLPQRRAPYRQNEKRQGLTCQSEGVLTPVTVSQSHSQECKRARHGRHATGIITARPLPFGFSLNLHRRSLGSGGG